MPERSIQKNGDSLPELLVWDEEDSPPAGEGAPVLWRSFGNSVSPGAISIPRLVETNAEAIRKSYLSRIYELGETRINGKRLVDHLEVRPGFSAWWMSLLVEKSYGKSAGIYDAIRLLAFEHWATGQCIHNLVLVSPNQSLAVCMRSWCANTGVKFEWHRTVAKVEHLSWLKRLYQSLPHSLRALAWLILRLVRRWPLRGVGLKEWCQTSGRATFVSYLFNLVPDAAKEARFESRYWGPLPEVLQREGCSTNWLHLYVKDELLPGARKAAEVIRLFNKTGNGGQVHVPLDAFLGPAVVFRALRDWIRLSQACRGLRKAHFSPPGTAIDLWPLFENDWFRSFNGEEPLNNLLHYNLFESALKMLPRQQAGVYLQENQGWEFALIYAWKAAGHGSLIGTPHSTVRYWDIRYFFDPRCYRRTGVGDLPMPDKVALNGAAARDAYLAGDYPKEQLVQVEALRYMHLVTVRSEPDRVASPSDGPLRVLVLGDFFLENTQRQMRLLETAAQSLSPDTIIVVKPHPACPVQPADYPGLRMEVTMESIPILLSRCDVAYASSATAAAVDAYCTGVPVVSVLDSNTLNLSPLRGRVGALFASTPEELASKLISVSSVPNSARGKQEFFTLDPTLLRWRRLLKESNE
jgi:surface carbohydrate biosynthesis protein (TIGR04326 family)